MGKGADFERTVCKQLSLWWTYESRDDVFWRSSQSGGRATIRGRQGKRTAGSYGDITALDPIGEPLLRLFTIELKRGRSHGDAADLIDCSGSLDCHPFLQAVRQAEEARALAGSTDWLLICRRDRRHTAIYFPTRLLDGPFLRAKRKLTQPPVFRFRLLFDDFVGMKLEKFLISVDPSELATVAGP